MPDLAVVIVSWNVRELLRACLDTLQQDLQASGLAADVYVVDNSSADGSAEIVSNQYPGIKLTVNSENLGFARGNNLVLRRITRDAQSEYRFVWLLNPDTEVQPGATRALVSCLEEERAAGIAGARLLHSDGSLQHGAFRFPGLTQLAFELFEVPARFYDTRLNGRYALAQYEQEAPFAIDHPLGASMMARVSVVADVGVLDEDYHMYCEEIDWCWRMRRRGWRAYCAPTASVVHHGGKSSAQVPVASFTNLWKSRARLYSTMYGGARLGLARAMVRYAMRRRARGASPSMAAACEGIVDAWGRSA